MRRLLKMVCGMSAAAVVAMAGTIASAGDLGLVQNGDVETVSRFGTHGIPGVDHPNGYPDAWHHSTDAAWSNGTTDPAVSPTHSLYIPDDNAGGLADVQEEMRSFATAIPGVTHLGRTLDLSWKWNWDITSAAGDKFSATVRISTAPVVSLDLVGAITDHVYLTDGSANSGGFQMFMTSIPLAAADQSFDIIFKTEDRAGPASELGVLFVDDISALVIPEPSTIVLCVIGLVGCCLLNRRKA